MAGKNFRIGSAKVAGKSYVDNREAQDSVKEIRVGAPPVSPGEADRYIVSAGTGLWLGHNDDVAMWNSTDGVWEFFTPSEGWFCWVDNLDKQQVYDSATWGDMPGGGSPGGSTTQIQFNDVGAFGGAAGLTWTKASNLLTVTGDYLHPITQASGYSLRVETGDGGTKDYFELQHSGVAGDQLDLFAQMNIVYFEGKNISSALDSGYFYVQTGNNAGTGKTGDISVFTGNNTNTGAVNNCDSGLINFRTGYVRSSAAAGSGDIQFETGTVRGSRVSGRLILETGSVDSVVGATAPSGFIAIGTGNVGLYSLAKSGNIELSVGGDTSSTGVGTGDIILDIGWSQNGPEGAIRFQDYTADIMVIDANDWRINTRTSGITSLVIPNTTTGTPSQTTGALRYDGTDVAIYSGAAWLNLAFESEIGGGANLDAVYTVGGTAALDSGSDFLLTTTFAAGDSFKVSAADGGATTHFTVGPGDAVNRVSISALLDSINIEAGYDVTLAHTVASSGILTLTGDAKATLSTNDRTGATTGSIDIVTGTATTSGNSGDINLKVGLAAGGTQGSITFQDGSLIVGEFDMGTRRLDLSKDTATHLVLPVSTAGTPATGALRWTAANKLEYYEGSWTGVSGGGGSPGGANTNIQFNDSGAFGGASVFNWNKTLNQLSLAGSYIQTINYPDTYVFRVQTDLYSPVDYFEIRRYGFDALELYAELFRVNIKTSYDFLVATDVDSSAYVEITGDAKAEFATNDKAGTSGNVLVHSGLSSLSGSSGSVQVTSGITTSGPSGAVLLGSGTAAGNGSGTTAVFSGDSNRGTGAVYLRSGNSTATGAYRTGSVSVYSGTASGTDKTGDINIYSSTKTQTAGGTGTVNMYSGTLTHASNPANSGSVSIRSGSVAGSGNSGDVYLQSGFSTSGDSGDIYFNVGSANSGVQGSVVFQDYGLPIAAVQMGTRRFNIRLDNTVSLVLPMTVNGSPWLAGSLRYYDSDVDVYDGVDWLPLAFRSEIGGGSPGGATTQIQFNDSGAFAGDADLTWDKTNHYLKLGVSTTLTTGGEASPDVDPGGVCLDHNSGDGNVLTFKNTACFHSFTTYAEADSYATFHKHDAVGAGLHINGFADANNTGIRISGYTNTTGTPATPIIMDGYKSNGAGGRAAIDNGQEVLTVTGVVSFLAGGGTRWSSSGKLSTGSETAPDVDDGGLCLNHGAGDGNVLTCKNSDVAHPFETGYDETDTYATFKKISSIGGGLKITGYTDGAEGPPGVQFTSIQGETTPTASGFYFEALKWDGVAAPGGGTVAPASTEKIFAVATTATKFTIYGDGSTIWASGTLSTGGEGAPDVDDGGVCLNHGSNDGNVITLKNSDVAHPFATNYDETDTYATFKKSSSIGGGLHITGFTDGGEGAPGVHFTSIQGETSPAGPGVYFEILGWDGTAAPNGDTAAPAADDEIFRVGTTSTKFSIFGNGSVSTNGEAAPDVGNGGLCLYQTGSNYRFLTLKSNIPSTPHTFTTHEQNDTYLSTYLVSATNGGVGMDAFSSDSLPAFYLRGAVHTPNISLTEDATVNFGAYKLSGTSRAGLTSSENAFLFTSLSNKIFLLKGTGNAWLGGTLATGFTTDSGVVDTGGAVFNHGTGDGYVLAFRNDDVAHPFENNITDRRIYGAFKKANDAAGGLEIMGITDGDGSGVPAIRIQAISGESTLADAPFKIEILKWDGVAYPDGNIVAPGAAEPIIDIRTSSSRIAIFGDGSTLWKGGKLATGSETAPDVDDGGLCLNHGAGDASVLTFKSDVAHGMTDFGETDTYGRFRKHVAANGGLQILGLTDDVINKDAGLALWGFCSSADTASASASSDGAIEMSGALKNGTAVTTVGTTGNVVVIKDNGATRFVFKGNGDLLYDGTASAYDDEDDIALVAAARYEMAQNLTMLREDDKRRLEELGVIKNGFVSNKRVTALQLGAIGQLWNMLRHMSTQLGFSEDQLLEMAKNYA